MYELCCRVIHCRGEVVRVIGTVGTRAEAEAWLKGPLESANRRGFPESAREVCGGLPETPECQVSICPLKHQAPRYFYRQI